MIDSNQFQNPIEIASEAPFKSAIANRHRDTTKAKKRAGKAPLPRYALSTINQAPNTTQENTHRKTSLSIDTTPHICHTEHSTTIASKIQIWTKSNEKSNLNHYNELLKPNDSKKRKRKPFHNPPHYHRSFNIARPARRGKKKHSNHDR